MVAYNFLAWEYIPGFLSVDISVYYKGFHGDLNETFFVGSVDEKSKKLVKASWDCLDLAIKEGKSLIFILH